MRRMFGARNGLSMYWKRLRLSQTRPYCTKDKEITVSNNNGGGDHKLDGSPRTTNEAYRQLENLDFMTAAKILFTTPPKSKKFGIDFHLVQLFFACMPSLAVYLVAQYARHEMRRMEAEQEVKKKAEEAKAKELELKAAQEEAAKIDPKLLELQQRLDKLEETVKDSVVSKRQGDSNITKTQSDGAEVKNSNVTTDESNKSSRSEALSSATDGQSSEQSSKDDAPSSSTGKTSTSTALATDAPQHNQEETQHKGAN